MSAACGCPPGSRLLPGKHSWPSILFSVWVTRLSATHVCPLLFQVFTPGRPFGLSVQPPDTLWLTVLYKSLTWKECPYHYLRSYTNDPPTVAHHKKHMPLASARSGPAPHSYGTTAVSTKSCRPAVSLNFVGPISFRLCFVAVLLVVVFCATAVSAMEGAADAAPAESLVQWLLSH